MTTRHQPKQQDDILETEKAPPVAPNAQPNRQQTQTIKDQRVDHIPEPPKPIRTRKELADHVLRLADRRDIKVSSINGGKAKKGEK